MKKMIGSLMLAGLLFAGTACGSDDDSTPSTAVENTTADSGGDSGGDSSGGSAAVADYCTQAEDLATQLKSVMADPTKGDVAALTQQAQELAAAAAKLSTANPDDVDKITECSKKITDSLGG